MVNPLNLTIINTTLFAVLEISLEQASYVIIENGRSIEVCAVVIGNPVLGGNFGILFSTEDSTTTSGV